MIKIYANIAPKEGSQGSNEVNIFWFKHHEILNFPERSKIIKFNCFFKKTRIHVNSIA